MRLRMDHAGRARRRGGLRTRRPRVSFSGSTGSSALAWLALAALGGCQAATPPGTVSSPPERAAAWIVQDGDSVSLVVEIARTATQQERGLAGRGVLESRSGMLFVFEEERSPDDGFWMWGTAFPLDIAFLDGEGTIRQILGMDTCDAASPDDCPGYFPDVRYRSALETHRGWFEENGIGVGARVRVRR